MDDKYARELIQSLSNGIDPFTGEVFPTDHVCNQPEIIRALNLLLNPPKRKNTPPNAGSPWSQEEDERLMTEFDSGTPLYELAKLHGRTRGAIQSRLLLLGKLDPRNIAF